MSLKRWMALCPPDPAHDPILAGPLRRVGLVAGASQGFGASFAVELAGRGMNVVLVSRQSDRLEELAQRLRANHGVETRCLVLDLAEQDAVAAIGNAVSDLDLGILVYNAAYVPVGRFLDVGEEVLEQVVRVNVRGPLLLARALLPGMSARGRGAVVLVSSLAGLHGAPRVAAYSASKAFNIVLAEALWGELSEQESTFPSAVPVRCPPGLPRLDGLEIAGNAFPG